MKCLKLLAGLCISVFITACNDSSSSRTPQRALQTNVDQQALQTHILDGFRKLNKTWDSQNEIFALGGPVAAAPASGADAAAAGSGSSINFSTTNVITAGVDEADVVKYDGTHLYVANTGNLPYYYIDPLPGLPVVGLASAPFVPQAADIPSVSIYATSQAPVSANEISKVTLSDADNNLQGIYVKDNSLVALSAYRNLDDYKPDIWYWSSQQFSVYFYDVSDKTTPTKTDHLIIDGQVIGSRLLGDELYIVSRFTPTIPGFIAYPIDSNDIATNNLLIDSVTPADLLPNISINQSNNKLLVNGKCIIAPNDFGFPSLTIISKINLNTPGAVDSSCLASDSDHFYMSQNAIYLTRTNTKQHTEIFQFDLASMSFAGSAEVNGYLPWRQKDFALYEGFGALRLFTVENTATGFTNYLTVLSASANNEEQLEQLSQLPNQNRPEPIGKPNEQLFGIRHVGQQSYAVTFEQIDPFYIIDVADTADPKITGSLEIPGVSNHLHPIRPGLILGIGRDANFNMKLELFDVNDIGNPQSLQSWSFPNASTNADWEHKAITQLELPDGTIKLAIPMVDYSTTYQNDLLLYQIDPVYVLPMVKYGEVNVDGVSYSRNQRSVLHDDAIYFVLDERVFSSPWSNPSVVTEAPRL